MLRMQYFNIQIASQLSGVAAATIRAWEKRYNAVVPERADNKHRLYSELDIEKLSLLFRLTEYGQSIGKIAHLDLTELKKVYETLLHKPYEEAPVNSPKLPPVDYNKIIANLHLALAAYKLDILSHELEKTKETMSPRDLCLHVIAPLFKEIGRRVYTGELTIAQEHTLSAIVSFHIGQSIGQHYQRSQHKSKLILITTPEHDRHEIGILSASLLCVHYGFRLIYLGVSLPASSIVETANALDASAVLLGVTNGTNPEVESSLESYVNYLQEGFQHDTNILVGGNLRKEVQLGLERRKVSFFNSLEALDSFLEKY
jgi:DNA-binding transcriptional MerR regulator/methylmalonyl-CoA mutase cobalamin-binding subunit